MFSVYNIETADMGERKKEKKVNKQKVYNENSEQRRKYPY